MSILNQKQTPDSIEPEASPVDILAATGGGRFGAGLAREIMADSAVAKSPWEAIQKNIAESPSLNLTEAQETARQAALKKSDPMLYYRYMNRRHLLDEADWDQIEHLTPKK